MLSLRETWRLLFQSLERLNELSLGETRVKVVKNKMAPPFKVVDFQILYGKGINRFAEIIEYAVKKSIIEK